MLSQVSLHHANRPVVPPAIMFAGWPLVEISDRDLLFSARERFPAPIGCSLETKSSLPVH